MIRFGHYLLGYSERGTPRYSRRHIIVDGKPYCGTTRTGSRALQPITRAHFTTVPEAACARCWRARGTILPPPAEAMSC